MISNLNSWVLLAGVALLGAVATANLFLRERSSRRQARIEELKLEFEYSRIRDVPVDVVREIQIEIVDEIRRIADSQRRDINEIADEIGDYVRTFQSDSPSPAAQLSISASPSRRSESDSPFLAEIAHSLKTPLAHIESVSRDISATTSSIPYSESRQLADELLASVEMCKATLAAFQELSRLSETVDNWSPESLNRSIRAMCQARSRAADKEIFLDLSFPERVPGYSNSFILSMLLPLIDNAVEEAPDGSKIQLEFGFVESMIDIRITNRLAGPFNAHAFEYRGSTTKSGHQGIGLSIARRLISSIPGAALDYQLGVGELSLLITMPRRIND